MCVTFNMFARNCLEKEVASYPLSKDTLYCNSRKNSPLNFVALAAAVPLLFGCFHTSVLGGYLSLFKTKCMSFFFPKEMIKDIRQRVRWCKVNVVSLVKSPSNRDTQVSFQKLIECRQVSLEKGWQHYAFVLC